MRSIARIDPVLKEMRGIWIGQPDLRLTQMLWNVREIDRWDKEDGEKYTISKFYNMEDYVLLDRLREQYGCQHINTEYLGMSKYGSTHRCRNCKEITYG